MPCVPRARGDEPLYGRQWRGVTVFPPKLESEAAMLKNLEDQRLDMIGRGGVRLYRKP